MTVRGPWPALTSGKSSEEELRGRIGLERLSSGYEEFLDLEEDRSGSWCPERPYSNEE